SNEMPLTEKVKIVASLFPKLSEPIVAKNLTDLSKIIAEQNPKDAKALALYGDVLYQQNKLREALSQYQEALKLNEQVYSVWEQIINIQTHETFNEEFECAEGEVIVRGHCVMKGYFNKPAETAEAIDKDMWFHTGDIGRFYKGNLQITDRLKNMIVNAYGKNVYPTPVENIYLKSPKIDQLFLIGDKREFITAIIIPNRETLEETFKLKPSFFEEADPFIQNKEIIDWIEQDIKKISNELAKFERIKNFKIKRNPFSIDEGEITPTMKIKRRIVEKKYDEAINEMYEEGVEAES
ncbi:MAG: hypothetical protein EOO43_27085, partial [Flavobacterium sp.]